MNITRLLERVHACIQEAMTHVLGSKLTHEDLDQEVKRINELIDELGPAIEKRTGHKWKHVRADHRRMCVIGEITVQRPVEVIEIDFGVQKDT